MPRKPAQPSLADEQAAPGGAAAVDRAMSLLAAFRDNDQSLSLAELAERTRLYKSTVLRLVASLEHANVVQRLPDGNYALGPEIDAGHPIVVLEPSCASVFRDELRNLFPGDARADRLRAQTFLLSEFLDRRLPGYTPPRLARPVLLHGHCHHKALMKMTDEESLLGKMGAALESIDAGCCGMAGPFGYAAETFAVSQAIGERVLLPAVRQAPADALIVADGFSCREQIVQATGRQAVHLAEVIQLALASGHSSASQLR